MAHYFLGVDGGGTNCRVRLCDANLNTLAEVTNGRSNLQLDHGNPAYHSISSGVQDVFSRAGLDASHMAQTYAVFGMAGARMLSAREEFQSRPWPFAQVQVFDDIDIARAGAHEGGDGAVIIVGTGSAGLALVEGGRFQVGGWGFHIGDQMSGAILGRELVRYAVEANDGLVAASPLTVAVLQRIGAGDINAVMEWSFDKRQPADYGALMPMFMDFLEQDDPVAQHLLELQLASIDRYVNYFKGVGAKRLAIVGGFGQRLLPILSIRYGDYVCMPKAEPLHGAVIMAQQMFTRLT